MSTYKLADHMQGLSNLGIVISVYAESGKPSGKEFKSEMLEKMLTERTPCQPEENGFLLREDSEARFSIVLQMPARSDVAVVLSSGGKDKRLSRLANLSKIEYLTVKKVTTEPIMDGCTTKPPNNGFKVISTADNILRLFEISITTRIYQEEGCIHFLTVQEVYKGQLYFDEASQTVMVPEEEYPGYRNWLSLRDLVSEMVDTNLLPHAVTPNPRQIPPVTEPNRGRVLFFNAGTGLGLVRIQDDQIAGLHWNKLDIEEPFPYVETGEEISFSISYTEKGFIKIAGVTPV